MQGVDLYIQVHGAWCGPVYTGPWCMVWTYIYRSMVLVVDLYIQVHGAGRGPIYTGPWCRVWTYIYRSMVLDVDLYIQVHGAGSGRSTETRPLLPH